MNTDEIILGKIKELKDDNFSQHKETINTFNRVNDQQQKLLDNHCARLRAVEKTIEELKPIRQFVADIQGKILSGFLTLLVVLGTIIYAFISYLNKKT